MTSYISTNARPCVDCGLRAATCVCVPRISQTTMERQTPFEDAYVISQPIPRVEAYTPDVDTLAGGLSWSGVMEAISEGPQSHAEGAGASRRVPVWSVVCLFAGLVLVALAMVMLSVVLPLHGVM